MVLGRGLGRAGWERDWGLGRGLELGRGWEWGAAGARRNNNRSRGVECERSAGVYTSMVRGVATETDELLFAECVAVVACCCHAAAAATCCC